MIFYTPFSHTRKHTWSIREAHLQRENYRRRVATYM